MAKRLQELESAEMAGICAEWQEPPRRDAFMADPVTKPYFALIAEANERLLKAMVKAPRDLSVEDRKMVREEQKALDEEHDQAARGLFHMLSALGEALPGDRERFEEARQLIFDQGLSVVNSNAANEAGQAARIARDVAANPDVQKTLAFPIGEHTLGYWFERIVAVGPRLAAVSARLALDETRTKKIESEHAARQHFIHIAASLRHILGLANLDDVQEAAILDPLDKVLGRRPR